MEVRQKYNTIKAKNRASKGGKKKAKNADEEEDEYFSKSDGNDSEGEKKDPKISMYCKLTNYAIIKEAGKTFCEFHLSRRPEADWDIAWFDAPPNDKFLKKMKFNQRVNHFPGIYNLSRKNTLGRHLMRMYKFMPKYYNFFPYTYMIPYDYKYFEHDTHGMGNQRTYIVKPDNSCQGKGIFLTRDPKDIK